MRRLLCAALAVVLVAAARSGEPERPVGFNRDIRPILLENCFGCHGPDNGSRKADLRLDRREDALAAEAFVPGKPEESELVRRIFADGLDQMPPAKTHKTLTAEQKETLKRWVAQGAEYQQHWAFITPVRPPVLTVKQADWVRNPIDAFVLAALEKRGLSPAPEADRRTLARRLSLDLVGLPPAPEDVEAFVSDTSPDYYEKYVDKLLSSPHWGEHRGRYWLDAARYADTHGIHFDNYREMWSYRDWVINAFNQNVPFDRFTTEQLAGDLLPNRTLDQQIASGFNRCNMTTNEGGAINEEYLVLYTRDRTETVSTVWLGLTANCAVCHDHKFDPLSQKEFYSLAAFFNNTTQAAMDLNIKDTPPVVPVPRRGDRQRFEELTHEVADVRRQLADRRSTAAGDFETWLKEKGPSAVVVPVEGLCLHAPLDEGEGRTTRAAVAGQVRKLKLPAGLEWPGKGKAGPLVLKAGRVGAELADVGDFEKDQPFTVCLRFSTGRSGQSGALVARMDDPENGHRGWDVWLENNRVGLHLISHWPDDAVKVIGQTQLDPKSSNQVTITYDGSGKAAGLRVYLNGRPESTTVAVDNLKNTTRTAVPFKLGQRHSGQRPVNATIADLRLYRRALSAAEVEQLTASPRVIDLIAKESRSAEESSELLTWWLARYDQPTRERQQMLDKLAAQEKVLRARGTVAYVMQEKPGEAMAYVLNRGEYDRRKDAVKPATPAILPPMPAELPRNRLGLAQWLMRPEHPLTARVTVNRFWQELFGAGLVRSTGDFGVTSELPSHPELLDWLAVEFRESGWDMKRFFRLMVTSSTYRQSAVAPPEKRASDPDNRWLSRGPRFRMDGEVIRDQALAASGLLVPKVGGPSVKPYQPDGVWESVAMIGSNTRDYKRDSGDALYRRSVYTFWKRAAPPATMEVFNAPNREVCTVRRERTNTPLQALVTLNDVQFVEAARVLAEKALKEAGSSRDRFDFVMKRLVARPARDAEVAVIEKSLAELTWHYADHVDDAKKLIAVGEKKADPSLEPATLAAWTMLVNQLMNLDEVLNK